MSIYATKTAMPLVSRKGFYGLISFDKDGNVHRYSYVDTGSQTIRGYFVALGWKIIPGRGFVDANGNKAKAYKDGEYDQHPEEWP